MCLDGSDVKSRTVYPRTHVTDRLGGFTPPELETLSSAGRRYRDVIPSYPGDLDGSSDVLWRDSMDMMPRPARWNAELVCGADFATKSTLFARSGVDLMCTGRRYHDVIPSCPGDLDS